MRLIKGSENLRLRVLVEENFEWNSWLVASKRIWVGIDKYQIGDQEILIEVAKRN